MEGIGRRKEERGEKERDGRGKRGKKIKREEEWKGRGREDMRRGKGKRRK